MDDTGIYSATIDPLEDLVQLEKEWLDLEARSDCSFFLSWTWVSTWVAAFDPACLVLRVALDSKIVSMALLTKSQFSKWNRFTSSRLHIHQKGNPVCDQVWTEYNGFLAEKGHRAQAIAASMAYLISEFPGWDELVVGAMTKDEAELLERTSSLQRHDLWKSPAYGVDLTRIRNQKQVYLESLSSNTRYQIRRSLKLYNQMGDISLSFAEDLETALSYLDRVAPLHLDRWGDGLEQSGFANKSFVLFHQLLIKKGWQHKQIDFIKVSCGDQVLGFFYNFLYRGRIYFYLSGLDVATDPKLKPGLCGHALSIQYYLEQGYLYYDFMGGDDRYKRNLGEQHQELYQIALQRPRSKFKVEHVLRLIKQALRR